MNAAPAVVEQTPTCHSAPLDEQVEVKQVVDGDTLRLMNDRLVRLIGINTPELGHGVRPDEMMAVEATRYLQSLLRDTEQIGLRHGVESHDRYGRMLAHAFLPDGRNIQAILLRAGMGAQILVPPNDLYAECYQQAEAEARSEQLGVWQSIYKPIEVDDLPRSQQGFRVIQGRIEVVGEGRFTLWPNFTRLPGEAPREGVTLRILRQHLDRFTSWQPQDLVGKRVEVRGWLYRDGRQLVMNVQHPYALRLLSPSE